MWRLLKMVTEIDMDTHIQPLQPVIGLWTSLFYKPLERGPKSGVLMGEEHHPSFGGFKDAACGIEGWMNPKKQKALNN